MVKFSKKIPHLTSTVRRLLSDRLVCQKEPIIASYPFLGYYLHKRASLTARVTNQICMRVKRSSEVNLHQNDRRSIRSRNEQLNQKQRRCEQ